MIRINMELLDKIVPQFRKTIATEGKSWQEERDAKDKFFREYFSKEKILKIEEGTLRELIHVLWAFLGWTNKDYLLQEMLKSGLERIRKAFDYLLYSDDSIDKRFNYARENIRIMGAAGISEILTHYNHTQYPIWNRRSKTGLLALGVPNIILPKSAQISGTQYKKFCELVRDVQLQVSNKYPEVKDLFDLDFLLYFISIQENPTTTEPLEIVTISEDFDHDDIIDQILELGDGLGFDVDKEVTIVRGCRIDAIWRSRIANLGTIAYAFEVHKGGSPDSAILNLQRVRRDPSIQKVILVSKEKELSKFREEILTLDENFRNSVAYFKVADLQSALANLESLKGILNNLGLLSGKTLFD